MDGTPFPGQDRGAFAAASSSIVTAMHAPNQTEGLRFRLVLKPGFALGPGKADLLDAIAATGSLAAAGSRLGMSQKRVWVLVREMNAAFRLPLIETEKGGSGGGGGARLSELGHSVLARYRAMEAEANAAIASGLAALRAELSAHGKTADTG